MHTLLPLHHIHKHDSQTTLLSKFQPYLKVLVESLGWLLVHAIGVNRCPNSRQIALTRLERDSQLLHQLHPCSIFVPGARVSPRTNVRKMISLQHAAHFSTLVPFAKLSMTFVKKKKGKKRERKMYVKIQNFSWTDRYERRN